MLDERTHDRRGPLGPEREPATALVFELVHLLGDDIGRLPHAEEHLEVLEDRGDDQAVAEAPGSTAERVDERGEPVRRRREDVVGPLRRPEDVARGGRGSVGHGDRAYRPSNHGNRVSAQAFETRQLSLGTSSLHVDCWNAVAVGFRKYGGSRYFSRLS